MIALHEAAHRRFTHVLLLHTAQEVVDETLPERPVRSLHLLDAERLEDGVEHGETAREDRRPLTR